YASTYLKLARSYADTLGISLGETRMAVVIQEVVGEAHGDRYYPGFSGTAASYNYYPLGKHLQPEDRIAFAALGLGATVVQGGLCRRFSPKRPDVNIYSSVQDEIKSSQNSFFAIRLSQQKGIDLEKGEENFLESYSLREAIEDGTLAEIADTYDPQGGRLMSGYWDEKAGAPVITFNRALKYNTFPLAGIIDRVLELGERAMGCPVELEFAGNLAHQTGERSTFRLLQLRPFLEHEESMMIQDQDVPEDRLLAYSSVVSGYRSLHGIQDIVYVKPEKFNHTRTLEMVEEVTLINHKLVKESKPYILIGPGRWGTCERHLGIPVVWSDINGAKVIMEVDLKDFQVDHSQGSHFFHNISSAGIPYFFVKYGSQTDFLDWDWLESHPAEEESEHLRHVRISEPLTVIANGKERSGKIIKP
ncbi:MAG: PEP/pyruvate-binding domain-containing protein, partial [Anaerolineales bacterium]